MEEVYIWLMSEPVIMHRFLENANTQVRDTVLAMGKAGISGWFGTTAHEMLIPPWMGRRQFDEVVFPYDKVVNDAVHKIGGRNRSHCHGNSLQFLERMSEMGVDAIEPLEPPPFGDVDLAEAKRRVGDRMVLSGNVPSQDFVRMRREEVRDWVRRSISVAACGGGYTLRTTGGHAGVNPDLEKDMLRKIIGNVEAYIEAGMEFGPYPIRV
jgi:uroporphyrinogen-III decarboxylase